LMKSTGRYGLQYRLLLQLYSKNLECTWNSCGSESGLARVQLRGVSVPCLVVGAANWEMAERTSSSCGCCALSDPGQSASNLQMIDHVRAHQSLLVNTANNICEHLKK